MTSSLSSSSSSSSAVPKCVLEKIKEIIVLFNSSIDNIIIKKKEIDQIVMQNKAEIDENITSNIIENIDIYFDEYSLLSLKNMLDCLLEETEYNSCNLNNICNHIIEEDDIDISLDQSKRIKYCIKCEQTF